MINNITSHLKKCYNNNIKNKATGIFKISSTKKKNFLIKYINKKSFKTLVFILGLIKWPALNIILWTLYVF